jgi:hypothetical protein
MALTGVRNSWLIVVRKRDFCEICGLGAAAGQIAVCLGLFKLGNPLVFFGLEHQRFLDFTLQLLTVFFNMVPIHCWLLSVKSPHN